MLSNVTVTLYDVFGYLFPGFVFLVGIAVLFWAIFIPTTTPLPPLKSTADISTWSVVVVVAYIVGHLAQAIGNFIGHPSMKKCLPSTRSLVLSKDEADSLPETLVSKARSRVKSILQIPQEDIDDGLLYGICDEIVVQSKIESVIANRDIYIYREGFYRGLTVSLVMLFLSLTVLTVRMLVTGTSLRLSDTQTAVSWPILLFVDLMLLIGAWLSFRRYRRFGGYRIRQAIIGFLVLDKPEPDENKPANEPGQ